MLTSSGKPSKLFIHTWNTESETGVIDFEHTLILYVLCPIFPRKIKNALVK